MASISKSTIPRKIWYFKTSKQAEPQGPFTKEEMDTYYEEKRIGDKQLVSKDPNKGFKKAGKMLTTKSSVKAARAASTMMYNHLARKKLKAKLFEFFAKLDPENEPVDVYMKLSKESGEAAMNAELKAKYGYDLNTFRELQQKEGGTAEPEIEVFSAFLSHAWGKDAEGRDNHKRVAGINNELKKAGLKTWFDSDRLKGNIAKQIADGIETSTTVVVFITKAYMEKLNGTADDNCKREFQYAVRRKTTANLIPVVLEKGMKDTSQWVGPLGVDLGGVLYIDMSTKAAMKENLPTLVAELKYRDENE